MLSKQEKLKMVQSIPFWWHTIDFGDGVVSKGHCPIKAQRIRASAIPKNLKNKTVLDVGCWDGFYTFLCEKKGAKVIAIDNRQQERFVQYKYGLKIDGLAGFRVAKKILNSKVRLREKDLYELDCWDRRFDIVLCLGVLYHLKYPFKAIEILYNLTKKLLVLETHYIKTKSAAPYMRFYPKNELKNDITVWWGPNIQCLLEMLKSVGFKRTVVWKKYYVDKDYRAIIKAYK